MVIQTRILQGVTLLDHRPLQEDQGIKVQRVQQAPRMVVVQMAMEITTITPITIIIMTPPQVIMTGITTTRITTDLPRTIIIMNDLIAEATMVVVDTIRKSIMEVVGATEEATTEEEGVEEVIIMMAATITTAMDITIIGTVIITLAVLVVWLIIMDLHRRITVVVVVVVLVLGVPVGAVRAQNKATTMAVVVEDRIITTITHIHQDLMELEDSEGQGLILPQAIIMPMDMGLEATMPILTIPTSLLTITVSNN
jgi:hypothetical protein